MRYVWNMKWHEIRKGKYNVVCGFKHVGYVCNMYLNKYFECFENEYKEQKKEVCVVYVCVFV